MRSTRQHDGRHVGTRGAHHLRRGGLVAVAKQHHTVERMGADHLLGVHRHQVAVEHRRRPHEELAERDGGELEWSTPRLPHAALHVLRQLAEVVVAVVQVALRLGDADDGPRKIGVIQTHALRERAAHEPIHVRVVEPRVRAFFSFNGHAREQAPDRRRLLSQRSSA